LSTMVCYGWTTYSIHAGDVHDNDTIRFPRSTAAAASRPNKGQHVVLFGERTASRSRATSCSRRCAPVVQLRLVSMHVCLVVLLSCNPCMDRCMTHTATYAPVVASPLRVRNAECALQCNGIRTVRSHVSHGHGDAGSGLLC
jgi:hypothetical protein